MKTNWDYSELALHYVKRPRYSEKGIDQVCEMAGLKAGVSRVCDVGAGTGILTRMLLERGYSVDAVEPNDEMRKHGIEHTAGFDSVAWFEGTGEETGRPQGAFDLVTFGSSFNVTDRQRALAETKRILKTGGWFCCMWNHRDLDDPLQRAVEECIKKNIPDYDYGTRREDQTEVIKSSGLFEEPIFLEARHEAAVRRDDYIEAWRSHATLQRQAKDGFAVIISEIDSLVPASETLIVPYNTRIWMARLR